MERDGDLPIRVLIADDDPSIRRLLKLLLAEADGIVVAGEAGGGRQAVELIERLCPDVALIDCTMPDLDCLDVVALIRARCGDVGVVVLDTYGQRATELLEAGASAYLLKDAVQGRLMETIREVAGHRDAQVARGRPQFGAGTAKSDGE